MFKDKLKQLRIERNLTQADVANAIGVSPATIGNYEQGTRQPKNKEMWQKLSDFLGVSVDELMDKTNSSYISTSKEASSYTTNQTIPKKKNPFMQFREDVPIIYDNVDITSLVFSKPGDVITTTRKQRYAYTEFISRSGHVLFARKNLLSILRNIKEASKDNIISNLYNIINKVDRDVIYWYKRCWCDVDDIFPTANSIETLYDLLNKCLCVDMIAEQEFTLIPLEKDYDWLREKLRS